LVTKTKKQIKKIILCCLTALTLISSSISAQQVLSTNLYSINGWRPAVVGGGTTPTSTTTCSGLLTTPQIPCVVSGNIDALWGSVKLSGAKFVRYGGTNADQNKPEISQ